MSSRSKRPQTQPSLSSIESLLLAQATWELGAAPASWQAISKILSKHPLLSRPKSFFTAQSCHSMFETLLKDSELEMSEANHAPQSPENLKLAQKHYFSRMNELRELILAEESKFKTVLNEIEEIRAGMWDKQIEAKFTGNPLPEKETTDAAANDEQDNVEPVDQQAKAEDQPIDAEKDASLAEESDDVEMREVEAVQKATLADDEAVSQRQEEEEEEEPEDEGDSQTENKEEEEEVPTREPSEPIDVDNIDEDETASPHNPEEAESEAPTAPEPEDGTEGPASETEEPVVTTRRSTRRKTSGAPAHPLLPTRQKRGKEKTKAERESHPADSDHETEGTPARDDDRASSPIEAGTKKRDGKRKASFAIDNIDSPQEKKRLREDSEPADDDEPGPSSHNTRARAARNATRTEEQKRFQSVISLLHSQISQHRNGTIFHNPIKPSEAPDYHDIVKRPMDLKTIKTRVKDGVIGNSLEFQRDIYLMFANAMMYNRPGSDVHGMTEDMLFDSEALINAFRQTEGLVKRGQRP